MNCRFCIFAAAVVAFFVAVPPSDAGQRKPIDPAIDTVSTVVGAGWTAGYFAINQWKLGASGGWDSGAAGISQAGAIVGTTMGCMATSPIVATAVLNRPLTYREAHILVGSCLIPIIGGWLINEGYNNGWLWAPDEKPVRKVSHRSRK
jgi:hypothetical protein